MANFLIADDSLVMRTILKYMLEKNGHTIIGEAKDGEEAVMLCRKLKPDAIALDAIMKGTDGVAALQVIKHEDLCRKIFIVLEQGQIGEEAVAAKMGAHGFFWKPFRINEVTAELKRVFISIE